MVVYCSQSRKPLSKRCHKVVFPTSLLQPKTNVVTTLCFRRLLSILVLTLEQGCDFEVVFLTKIKRRSNIIITPSFQRYANIALQYHFLIKKIYSVCVNKNRLLNWCITENLQYAAWANTIDFWSCLVHWSEKMGWLGNILDTIKRSGQREHVKYICQTASMTI